MRNKSFINSNTWIISFLYLLFLAAPVWAFDSPDMPKDLERLRDSGQIRVAVLELGAPPFVIIEGGKLSGADVDMARDIASNIGVKAVFVKIAGGYDKLIQVVAENKADIGVCELSKTIKRSQAVFFSRPYMVSGFTLLVNRLSAARMLINGNS